LPALLIHAGNRTEYHNRRDVALPSFDTDAPRTRRLSNAEQKHEDRGNKQKREQKAD
jgi:hypothetical protein